MRPIYEAPLMAGDAGTEQTISKIRELYDAALRDSFVNRTAIEIVRGSGAQQFDDWAQAMAIYEWVRSNFYFVNDPVNKEALRPARDLLKMRAGDCDDINAILLPSLLGSIGLESRLVTIAADRRDPSLFSHVYAEVEIHGEWIPIDAARPGAAFGLEPPHFYRREWWSLTCGAHGEYDSDNSGGAAYFDAGVGSMALGELSPNSPQCRSVLRAPIGPGGIAVAGQPIAPNFSVTNLLWVGAAFGLIWLLGKK